MDLASFLKAFRPHATAVPLSEKLRSGLVAGLAVFLLGLALKSLPSDAFPLLMLASMAASAMLLFAAPHSPMSQPWNLVGGHLVSATVGLVCIQFIHDPLLSAGMGVGAAIFLMHYLNCLHPPGAATALILILNSEKFHSMGWQGVMLVVIVNACLSLLLALALNNMLPGRRYPTPQVPQTAPKSDATISFEQRDLEWALTQMDGVIDISEDDLAKIYQLASRHAQERYDSALSESKP